MKRTGWAVIAAIAGMVGVTGCQFGGLNSYPLPLTEGNGADAYTVTVEMANAVNLVPNSEVKVGDLTVGSVRKIEVADWHAELTVGLNKEVRLPANTIAQIGQKSLLGAEYLELQPPADEPARGRLRAGDRIRLPATGRYPETEEVLTSLSLVLNGGGLNQMQTITAELKRLLKGREQDARALLANLNTFTSALDSQRAEIVEILDNFDRLGKTLVEQNRTVAEAVQVIPRGLKTLNAERKDLVRAMEAVSDARDVAQRVLDNGGQGLVRNLRALAPSLRELADAGKDLPESIGGLTPLFPLKTVTDIFKGDFINFFVTVDLTTATLKNNMLSGTPLESLLAGGPLSPALEGPGTDGADPLRSPLEPLEPLKRDPVPKKDDEKSPAAEGDEDEALRGLIGSITGGR